MKRPRGRPEIYGPKGPGLRYLHWLKVRKLLREFCGRRCIPIEELTDGDRSPDIVAARRDFCLLTKELGLGIVTVAKVLGTTHWTVQYWRNPNMRERKMKRNRDIVRQRQESYTTHLLDPTNHPD